MVNVAVVSPTLLAVSVAAVSSSLIVTVAVASPSVAPVGLLNVSVKVSSGSISESSYTNTGTRFKVSPGSKVSGLKGMFEAAWKSVPLVAVPLDVAYSTVHPVLARR